MCFNIVFLKYKKGNLCKTKTNTKEWSDTLRAAEQSRGRRCCVFFPLPSATAYAPCRLAGVLPCAFSLLLARGDDRGTAAAVRQVRRSSLGPSPATSTHQVRPTTSPLLPQTSRIRIRSDYMHSVHVLAFLPTSFCLIFDFPCLEGASESGILSDRKMVMATVCSAPSACLCFLTVYGMLTRRVLGECRLRSKTRPMTAAQMLMPGVSGSLLWIRCLSRCMPA
jgi:hypothetical protein